MKQKIVKMDPPKSLKLLTCVYNHYIDLEMKEWTYISMQGMGNKVEVM